jgi:hypothetical protein
MLHGLKSIKIGFRAFPALPIILRPAADASFTLLDGRPIVFSETKQKIYELNRIGAYIWCELLEGKTIEMIASELRKCGVGRRAVHQFVRQALHQWLDLGLIHIDWEPLTEALLQTQFASLTVAVQASGAHLLKRLDPILSQFGRGTAQGQVLIEILEFQGQVLFRIDKGTVSQCQIDGLAPAIKAALTEHIVSRDQPDIALHAASLVRDDKGLLICGRPGAGESTLTLQLIHAGFRYSGDDVVLITPDGQVEGLPFAPSVKPGSWEMISQLRSDLHDAPVHRRTDGIPVRYLPVEQAHQGRFSIRWIIFLNRVDSVSTELTPVGRIDAMGRVIDQSFAANGQLSRRTFLGLKRMLAGSDSFELAYSDAVDARRALVDLCHGQS